VPEVAAGTAVGVAADSLHRFIPISETFSIRLVSLISAAVLVAAVSPLLPAVGAAEGQTYFVSPDAAVDALIEAAVADDPDALRRVLGPEIEELRSSDPVADAQERQAFAEAAVESAKIDESGDDRAVLVIGADDWPFPIPLVKDAAGWRFDTQAGADELMSRRIGSNELTTIDVLRELVEAEHEYQAVDRDGDGVRAYAQRLLSTKGKRDGLYWPTKGDEPESPVGALVAEAAAQGYSAGKGDEQHPYHGYLFRLLDAQGAGAPGGEKGYRDAQGRLVGGFAILAYPVQYGVSGIMTFVIDQSGMLFQKDLGGETAAKAQAISRFDPDKSWTPVLE